MLQRKFRIVHMVTHVRSGELIHRYYPQQSRLGWIWHALFTQAGAYYEGCSTMEDAERAIAYERGSQVTKHSRKVVR